MQVTLDGQQGQLQVSGLQHQMQCKHPYTLIWTSAVDTVIA